MSNEETQNLLKDDQSKSINASAPSTPSNPVDFQTVITEFRQNFGLSTIFTALVCIGTLAVIFGIAPGLLLAPRPQRLDFPLNPNEQRLLSYPSGIWTKNVSVWNSEQGIFSQSVWVMTEEWRLFRETKKWWDEEELGDLEWIQEEQNDEEIDSSMFAPASFYVASVAPPLIQNALNVTADLPIFINSTAPANVSIRVNSTYTFSLLKGSRISFNFSASNGTDFFVVKGYQAWLEFSDSTPSGSFFKRLNATNNTFVYDVSMSDTYYFYLRSGGVPTRSPLSGNISISINYALYNTSGLQKLNQTTRILSTKDHGGFVLVVGPQRLDQLSSVSYRVWPRYSLFFGIFGAAMALFVVVPTVALGVFALVFMILQCIKKRREKMMV